MMLTDDELDAEYAAVRAWVLDPQNRADPSYAMQEAYLARLEAVVLGRKPQRLRRAARQEAERREVRASAISFILPGLNTSLIPFITELIHGMGERLEQLPGERTARAVTRFNSMSLRETVEFAVAFLKGVVFGFGHEVWGIVELLALPIRLLEWLYRQTAATIENWDAIASRVPTVRDRFARAAARVGDEILKALRDPRTALTQLDELVDTMIRSGLDKANQWGQEAVDEALGFLEQPFAEVGEKVGHVVGQILFNVLLLVGTEAIGNLIKWGAGLAGRLTRVVVGVVADVVAAIRSFISGVIRWIRGVGRSILSFLADSWRLVTEALEAVEELFASVRVAETTGGVRVPVSAASEASETGLLASSIEGGAPGRTTMTTVEELVPQSKAGEGTILEGEQLPHVAAQVPSPPTSSRIKVQAARDYYPGHRGEVGTLEATDGRPMYIKSGEEGGPWGGTQRGGIPRGKGEAFTSGGPSQGNIATHVEGHSAAIMHQQDIQNATLTMGRDQCSICARNLPTALPPGSQLTVGTRQWYTCGAAEWAAPTVVAPLVLVVSQPISNGCGSSGVTSIRQRVQRRDGGYLLTRNRRMVTAPDRVLLTGSRSILPRPGDEKRMPSPSSTGSTYTRISSTRPRRRHWPATSAPRISRFLPPAALSAVATASPMSPLRYVTFGSGGSGGSWVRTNTGPENGYASALDADPRSLAASILLPTSLVRRPTSMAPVAAAISENSSGAVKSKIQSIASPGPAMASQ